MLEETQPHLPVSRIARADAWHGMGRDRVLIVSAIVLGVIAPLAVALFVWFSL